MCLRAQRVENSIQTRQAIDTDTVLLRPVLTQAFGAFALGVLDQLGAIADVLEERNGETARVCNALNLHHHDGTLTG